MDDDDAQNGGTGSLAGRSGRAAPPCSACGGSTRFAGGSSTHDLYAERFVCESCGRETYRSFGRGSVS